MYDSITIITDCFDDNARWRQVARFASLFPSTNVQLLGVKSDIQAAGFLVDIIDSFLDGNHLVVVNIAPRHGEAKKRKNGTPFGYFEFDGHTIISSVDGYVLSLVKKLQILKTFFIWDIPTVLEQAFLAEEISEEEKEHIMNSQFRSFEFLPRIAIWMAEESFEIPSKTFNLDQILDIWNKIWHIDNFWDCKTTILASEFKREKIEDQRFEDVAYKKHLSQVETDETAFTVWSSWFDLERFIEISKWGWDASDALDIYIWDEVK
jgi:hypothetical protein